MSISNIRPIIRHWNWFYDLLIYNSECKNLNEDEKFLHYLNKINKMLVINIHINPNHNPIKWTGKNMYR